MSLENEDRSSLHKPPEKLYGAEKKSRIAYTREFLLSLSELDFCKKLPIGFDASILSELEDSSAKAPGNLPLQGFRRTEYGSSPPTRGDSGNSSRGIYGRWESRSSERSDSQSDKDSDSGRRYGSQSRRWQTPEHDGLLGSGSFPRPPPGISGSKVRANEPYQLNRSSEPYHPPRSYKAVPYSRRDTHDSYNDETFGSTECNSEDRAEEERRRRASFELMRKEQQKVLQEKQKLNLQNKKADGLSGLCEFLEDSQKEKRPLSRKFESDISTSIPVLANDSDKSSFVSHISAPRLLVPPGFANSVSEKNSGLRPAHFPTTEVGKPVTGESSIHSKTNSIFGGPLNNADRQSSEEISLVDGQLDIGSRCPILSEGDQILKSHLSLDSSKKKPSDKDQLSMTSSVSDAYGSLNEDEVIELHGKVSEDKVGSESLLEKIFGRTAKVVDGGSMELTENHERKFEEILSPSSVQSSKFAHWFLEEEATPANGILSERPDNLLSLIVGSSKGGFQDSGTKRAENFLPEAPDKSSDLISKLALDMCSASNGVSEPFSDNNTKDPLPVLTCEDLEQSILSEYSENYSSIQQPMQPWGDGSSNMEEHKTHSADSASGDASKHLLLLLQKEAPASTIALEPRAETENRGKLPVPEEHGMSKAVSEPKVEEDIKNIQNLGKTLTLETLFGSAFMQELQSVEAPVSVQRGSTEPARNDAPEPYDGLLSPTIDKIGLRRPSHEGTVSASSQRQQSSLGNAENWLPFNNSQLEINSSKDQTEVVSKHGAFDGAVEFQLPEEESLITLSDPLNPHASTVMPTVGASKGDFLSPNAPADIADKLAALGAFSKDERAMVGPNGLPFGRSAFERREPEILYPNLQSQSSQPQFQPHPMSHGRPIFHTLESHPPHMSSQMKFMGPESMFNHDTSANHQFPPNVLHPPIHPSAGVAGFDLPTQHPILHQMQVSGNAPPHLLHDFSRMPPVPGNQSTGFMQQINRMQGFPFGPQQPSTASLGLPIPGLPGRNPPESFQRLIEVELQAKSKQIHPFAGGSNQGIYSHELDMGLRYR